MMTRRGLLEAIRRRKDRPLLLLDLSEDQRLRDGNQPSTRSPRAARGSQAGRFQANTSSRSVDLPVAR
jgi:hypothetical protein